MAKDSVHYIVQEALINDGWTITADPLVLKRDKSKLEIDFAAEKLITAERGIEKIAVEVKTFVQHSIIHAFHEALGQYLNYLTALKLIGDDRTLFLAIDLEVHGRLMKSEFIKASLQDYGVKLLIFDVTDKSLKQWIK
jgi:hypothetical protein